MKRTAVILLLVLIITALTVTLSACREDETEYDYGTYYIGSAEELLAVKDKLGAVYDYAKFELTSDITVETDDWTPIGGSVDKSFRSSFNGNNHTITIDVYDYDHINIGENSCFGLFGYVYDAEISDLKLDVRFRLITENEVTHVAALAGYAFGNCSFNNIEIDGDIEVKAALASKFSVPNDREEVLLNKFVYIGGLAGYANGETVIDGVQSNLKIFIDEDDKNSNEFYEIYGFNSVFAGGLTGFIRTVDISDTNAQRNSVNNIESHPDFNIKAKNIYAGGVAGISYNTDYEEITVSTDGRSEFLGRKHKIIGGAFGLLDNCVVKNAGVNVDLYFAPTEDVTSGSGLGTANNFGGIAGYINNGTLLDTVSYTGDIYAVFAASSETYGGGLVGVVSYSTVKNSEANGGFVVSGEEINTAEGLKNAIVDGTKATMMVKNYAGIAGKAYGISVFDNVYADFVAYQGIIAEIAKGINIIFEDKNGEMKPVYVETDDVPVVNDNVKFANANSGAYHYENDAGIRIKEERFLPNAYGVGI